MAAVLGVVEVSTSRFPGWHPHFDVWALVAALALAYGLALRAERARGGEGASRRQVACFGTGLLVIWLAADWPVHDLAEGYLYSVHMFQHLMFTLVAAPLLLYGTPAWLARRLLGGAGAVRVLRGLSRPVVGLIQFNLVVVISHWPPVVDATLRDHPLHFFAHAVLLVSALLMWMPVASPLPEVPRAQPPTQMLYLFLQGIVPTVPASFLTFGAKPLYHFYEHVPRLYGISALSDQQVAGLIMKIGGGFTLWGAITLIFFRWYGGEERAEAAARLSAAGPVPSAAMLEPSR
ncbi:MAG: cytochrome c oxidase assembly protein [Acidimicrobiales bacterium]